MLHRYLFYVTGGDDEVSSGSFLRQTILFTAYETPETRALFNKSLRNVAGKIRSEHLWPPLQVPEGVEPVSALAEPARCHLPQSLELRPLRLFKPER